MKNKLGLVALIVIIFPWILPWSIFDGKIFSFVELVLVCSIVGIVLLKNGPRDVVEKKNYNLLQIIAVSLALLAILAVVTFFIAIRLTWKGVL